MKLHLMDVVDAAFRVSSFYELKNRAMYSSSALKAAFSVKDKHELIIEYCKNKKFKKSLGYREAVKRGIYVE